MKVSAYFDTCIVSEIAKEDVKESELIAIMQLLRKRLLEEIYIFTSESTLDELNKIPEKYREKHLDVYSDIELIPKAEKKKMTSMLFMPGPILFLQSENPAYWELKTILPDKMDAEHLLNASEKQIVYFITVDERTILKFANKIKDKTNLRAMLPSQLMTELDN